MRSLNKTVLLLIAIAPVLMADQCGVPNYGAAHIGNETPYLAKAVYTDTCERAIYISGRFSHTTYPNYDNEKTWFGELSFHRSHTWKYANLSYGAFGFAGQRKIYLIEQHRGFKYFAGGGVIGEFNVNIPFKKVDWRIIGVRGTLYYEGGEYASFRSKAAKEFAIDSFSGEYEPLIENNNPNNFPFNISGYSELVIKLNRLNFGVYGLFGVTVGDGDNSITATFVGLHFTHRRMTYFAQYSAGEWEGSTVAGGLAYRINRKTAARCPKVTF